jgi:hypothetical protein
MRRPPMRRKSFIARWRGNFEQKRVRFVDNPRPVPHIAPRFLADGRLPKWPTGADCKSAGLRLRWFESSTYHHSQTRVKKGESLHLTQISRLRNLTLTHARTRHLLSLARHSTLLGNRASPKERRQLLPAVGLRTNVEAQPDRDSRFGECTGVHTSGGVDGNVSIGSPVRCPPAHIQGRARRDVRSRWARFLYPMRFQSLVQHVALASAFSLRDRRGTLSPCLSTNTRQQRCHDAISRRSAWTRLPCASSVRPCRDARRQFWRVRWRWRCRHREKCYFECAKTLICRAGNLRHFLASAKQPRKSWETGRRSPSRAARRCIWLLENLLRKKPIRGFWDLVTWNQIR